MPQFPAFRWALVGAWLAAAMAWAGSAPAELASDGKLTAYFFDVGQGDAALIVSPTGKTVLIDAGPPDAEQMLVDKLRPLLSHPLDLVVLSHAHLDHLGGMQTVLAWFGAKRFLEPGFVHTTQAYGALLEYLGKSGIEVRSAESDGEKPLTVGLGGNATLEVLWPKMKRRPFLTGTRSDVNANSLVARVRMGEMRFLFTGDAEEPTEAALLSEGSPLNADVLKVAHHGSRHSSTPAFVAAVRPSIAIVSSGRENPFRHPSPPTLERLRRAGASIFRTDQDGDVRAVTDGTTLWVSSNKSSRQMTVRAGPSKDSHWTRTVSRASSAEKNSGDSTVFVAHRRSKVFHKSACRAAQSFSGKDRLVFGSREEATLDRGPAKDCRP
jgi:competence protein ComEC